MENLPVNEFLLGAAEDRLKDIQSESVDCCVTSPPYWGLRDYGNDKQVGLEKTPEEFINNLVKIFRQVKRVLKSEGTLWVNIGDCYAGSGKGGNPQYNKNSQNANLNPFYKSGNIKAKDLVGIPWMLAFALRADGWYLRQDIIWNKPNPMPESVNDRCSKSHEYIFLLSKSPQYYFNSAAIKEPLKNPNRDLMQSVGGKKHKNIQEKGQKIHSFHKTRNESGEEWKSESGMANKKSVWTVTTKPFNKAHFATFPIDLIIPCIKAGSPIGGIVLDPFMGSGTTAKAAIELQRNFIGVELNQDYINIAEERIRNTPIRMFA
jgi:DNA modification methylase